MSNKSKEKSKFRKPQVREDKVQVKEDKISRLGWKVIGIGIAVLVLGFFILSKTDPEGKNWASILSPFLIIGGYIIIGIGIILPEKIQKTKSTSGQVPTSKS